MRDGGRDGLSRRIMDSFFLSTLLLTPNLFSNSTFFNHLFFTSNHSLPLALFTLFSFTHSSICPYKHVILYLLLPILISHLPDPILPFTLLSAYISTHTLSLIQSYPSSTHASPLHTQIQFKGEEAMDAGGVRKEYFMLLMRDIMDPIYGMFRLAIMNSVLYKCRFIIHPLNK